MASSTEVLLSRLVKDIIDVQAEIRAIKLHSVHAPLNAGPTVLATINGGEITAVRPHISLIPQTGTTDDLDSIDNPHDGKVIALSLADAGDVITIKHHTEVVGGNISLREGVGYVLDDVGITVLLMYKDTTLLWEQIGFADPPSGGVPAAHAPSHQHGGSDQVATAIPAPNAIPKAEASGLLANGWLDATLASLANLGTVADRIAYTTGVDVWAETPLTAFARTILDDANQAAVRVTLALTPGTDVQAFDATLATIAALNPTTDQSVYFTATNVAATYSLTSFGRTLAALADAAAGRTALGLVAGGAGDIWVEKAGDTMSGVLNMGSQLITNLATPLSANDATTKAYVDALANGLDVKASVRAATTVNITLSGPQTIDGVAVVAGDRVLVKNQSTGANNGIYVVAAGAWTRSADADTSAEVTSGMFTFVTEGPGSQGDTGWVLTTNDPITLGSTSLVFSQFSGPINIAASISGASTDDTIADADIWGYVTGGVLVKTAWSNIKAVLTTAFNLVYGQLAAANTWSAAQTYSDGVDLNFTDPDVAHGMTSVRPTDQWGEIGELDAAGGGMQLVSLSDTDQIAFQIVSIVGSETPTVPPINFIGRKKSGTTSQAVSATEFLLRIQNFSTVLLNILGNGDMINQGSFIAEAAAGGHVQARRNDSTVAATNDIGFYDFVSNDASLAVIPSVVARIRALAMGTYATGDVPTAIIVEQMLDDTEVLAEVARFSELGFLGVGSTAPVQSIHARRVDINPGMIMERAGTYSAGGQLGIFQFRFLTDSLAQLIATWDGFDDAAKIEIQTQPTGGTLTTRWETQADGDTIFFYPVFVEAGISNNNAVVGGVLHIDFTTVGNIGGGADVLNFYDIPANTLNVNGQSIWFEASGTVAANGNTKTISVTYGATTIVSLASAFGAGSIDWEIRGRIIRTGATTQRVYATFNAAANTNTTNYDVAAETLSGVVTLAVVGQSSGSATDDVQNFTFIVGWDGANP